VTNSTSLCFLCQKPDVFPHAFLIVISDGRKHKINFRFSSSFLVGKNVLNYSTSRHAIRVSLTCIYNRLQQLFLQILKSQLGFPDGKEGCKCCSERCQNITSESVSNSTLVLAMKRRKFSKVFIQNGNHEFQDILPLLVLKGTSKKEEMQSIE
jgi:hypothetical protein